MDALDAIVIGAGPAGSTAARELARRGRSVLLLDRRAFPREKVCGDALIPDALAALARLGLAEEVAREARPLAGLVAYSPGRVPVPLAAPFQTLRRDRFDALLAAAAVRAGARFERARVAALDTSSAPGAVRVVLDDGRALAPRLVIVATGADVSLLGPLGVVARRAANAAAVRCYVRADDPLDRLVISYDRSVLPGYGWIFPMPDGWFNVGCGVFLDARRGVTEGAGLRALFERFTASFPPARALFERAHARTPLRGAALRCGLSGTHAVHGAGVLVAGESLGATFPFTGEGIGKALETGALAADAVDAALATGSGAGALAAYTRDVAALAPRYRGYAVAQRWLSHAAVCDLIARRAHRSRWLRGLAEGILTETVDPRALFSPWGLLRSLWR